MVKTLCVPCFPAHYDIVNKFVYMYHSSLSHHVSICSHCCSLERVMEGGGATKVLSHIMKQGKGAWSRSAAHIPVILTSSEIVLSRGEHTLLYG